MKLGWQAALKDGWSEDQANDIFGDQGWTLLESPLSISPGTTKL
jgi:hypothetical protein